MNNKSVLIITAFLIVMFGFLSVVYVLLNGNQNPAAYADITKINQSDHVKWSPEKKNVLVEYSDFQCPACKNFHDILKTFEASDSPDFKITKNITFIFRHYPLFQIHVNAFDSAYAAEAAGKQGKFYEMSDLLFKTQEEWSKLPNNQAKNYFTKLAADLKIDRNKYLSDFLSEEVRQKVNDDLQSGNKAGINSTPTFFLNGKKLDDIKSMDEFKQLLKRS